MIQTATIQVRQRGTVTLPARFRAKYGLKGGGPVTILDLDGALLLVPRTRAARRLAGPVDRLLRKQARH
jgi:bifunctional DNA-binding transcriptional regulator/antitoxin component of YhaV-PrlF toxin-antitoxin module